MVPRNELEDLFELGLSHLFLINLSHSQIPTQAALNLKGGRPNLIFWLGDPACCSK
ncbi:UNVERIFIED_CONTAM: hypothetical protein Sangu_2027700 [Sesamum angustifolium]|uniref:Uncharacterized protein n=1 Tax=Sesamum angustifolium TaxID=2727405 RepID=A0AAW2LJX9_9LAMI